LSPDAEGTDPPNIPKAPEPEPRRPDRASRPPEAVQPGESTRRLQVKAVVAGALVLGLALSGAGLAVEAAGSGLHGAQTRSAHIAGALACLALMIVAARWAVRIESRLRRRQPISQAFERDLVPAAAPPETRLTKVLRRAYGPTATKSVLGLFALIAIGCGIAAALNHSGTVRSAYVQAHGIRARATVIAVGERKRCGTEHCSYTAEILASLTPPVRGARGTFIHYPAYSKLNKGQQVTVLVDPKEPTYAEIPGVRFQKGGGTWIAFAVMAALFAVLAVLEWRALQTLRTYRRTYHPPA
jgi:hypothetical protein